MFIPRSWLILLSHTNNDKFVHNLSSRRFSHREKFLLSFSLRFSLPLSPRNPIEFYYHWEKAFKSIKENLSSNCIESFRFKFPHLARNNFHFNNRSSYWHPSFTRQDYYILKSFSRDETIVILRPDKVMEWSFLTNLLNK